MSGKPVYELHIEELVLHGFAPADRHTVADAVQAELTRLLAAEALDAATAASLPRTRSHAHVDAGSFRVGARGASAALGAQVAGAIHGAIGGAGGRR